MSMPELNTVGRFLYGVMEPYAIEDDINNYDLAHFCNGIGTMFEEFEQLARDREEGIGWSMVLDLQRAPEKFLAWLAQFVGSVLSDALTDPQKREQIASAPGWARGSVPAIEGAPRPFLSGTKTVYLTERVDGSSARHRIAVWLSEVINSVAIQAALAEQKPGGDIFEYVEINGGDFETLDALHTDFQHVKDSFATFADLRDDPAYAV